jgi:hypothetical protein
MKKLAVLLAAIPLFTFAQAPQQAPQKTQPPPPTPPPAGEARPAPRPGQGPGMREERHQQREERYTERQARREQRARLARTLGLAEILELDEGQALKLRDQLSTLDGRRERAREQLRIARETLARAADEDREKPVSSAEVDQAIQRMFAARAELEAIDRDTLAALPKDLTPDKRARAAIFLQRFSSRFGPDRMMEERKVIRVPGMDGAQGFHFEIPDMQFEMRAPALGVPGPDFDPFVEHELEDAEDL